MNRREFLLSSSAGSVAGISGCLDTIGGSAGFDPDENDPEADEAGKTDVGLRFEGVYAAKADREFIDGEYLLLRNVSEGSLDVSEHVIEYPTDRTYRVGELALEPGAQFALVSRSGDDTILESDPPVYLRYAGFDTGTAALGGNGTVRVTNAAGTLITEASYEEFGCDGGSVTDGSGDEIECLHGS